VKKDYMQKRKVREFDGVPYALYGTARESAVADQVQLACQGKGAMTRLTHRFFPRKYFIWVDMDWYTRTPQPDPGMLKLENACW